MPITLIAADPALQSDTIYAPYRDRQTTLLWADSLIGEAFTGRAPEVRWVLPPELRKAARRSPGIVGDPDQMGQAMLRSPKLKDIPDPLRSSLRNLMAVVGGRAVMVPASLGFGAAGRRADPRRSHRSWSRTPGAARCSGARRPWAAAPTRRPALDAALTAVLPLDTGGP